MLKYELNSLIEMYLKAFGLKMMKYMMTGISMHTLKKPIISAKVISGTPQNDLTDKMPAI